MNAGFGKPSMGSRDTKSLLFFGYNSKRGPGIFLVHGGSLQHVCTGRVPAGSLALRRGTGLVGGGGWRGKRLWDHGWLSDKVQWGDATCPLVRRDRLTMAERWRPRRPHVSVCQRVCQRMSASRYMTA